MCALYAVFFEKGKANEFFTMILTKLKEDRERHILMRQNVIETFPLLLWESLNTNAPSTYIFKLDAEIFSHFSSFATFIRCLRL